MEERLLAEEEEKLKQVKPDDKKALQVSARASICASALAHFD
jgi:hypothetical protein